MELRQKLLEKMLTMQTGEAFDPLVVKNCQIIFERQLKAAESLIFWQILRDIL
jgi:hypothetical protein